MTRAKSLKHLLFCFVLLSLQSVFAAEFIELGRLADPEQPFRNPQAISVGSDGTVYVVDTGNNRIVAFDRQGRFIKSIGGFGFEEDQFDQPLDIWTGSIINLYVADYNNDRVQRYDRNLNFLSSLDGGAVEEPFAFSQVAGCAVNSNNDLFVLERGEIKIIKFNRFGKAERSFGDYESGDGELIEPHQIDILQNKYVVVSDAGLHALKLYDFFGTYLRSLQTPAMKKPLGLASLPDERLMACDPEAKKIWLWKKDLRSVSAVKFPPNITPANPRDIAGHIHNGQLRLYLIDGNQILIGYLH